MPSKLHDNNRPSLLVRHAGKIKRRNYIVVEFKDELCSLQVTVNVGSIHRCNLRKMDDFCYVRRASCNVFVDSSQCSETLNYLTLGISLSP